MADPAPRRPRRARRAVLAALAVLALAGIVLWEFLPAIVERIAVERLVAMGIPSPELTVSRLGLDGAVLTGVVFGEAGELTAREVLVGYRLPDLFAGKIGDITIRGARLHASIGPDGLSLGSLDPLLAGGGGGSEIALPPIRLEDSHLELATPAGPIALTGNGTITLDETAILATLDLDASAPQGTARGTVDLQAKDGAITATLHLAESRLSLPDLIGATVSGDATLRVVDGGVTALQGAFSLTDLTVATPMASALPPLHGGVTVERGPNDWQASLVLADPGGDLAVELRLSTPAPDLETLVSVGLDVDATFAAPLWPLLDLPQPTAGDVGFHLVAEIQPSQLAGVLAGGALPALGGTLVLEAEELSWPGRIASLSGVAGFDLLDTDSGIALLAPAPTQVELTLAPAVLDDVGVPPDLATILTSPLLVTIDTRSSALSFSRTELKFHGDPQLEISLAGGRTLVEGGMNGFVGFAWPQNARLPGDAPIAPAPKQAVRTRLDALGPLAAAYLQFGFDRLDVTLYPQSVFGGPDGAVALKGSARGDDRDGLASLDLTAAFPTIAATGLEARDLKLDLPLEMTRNDGSLAVRLRDKGSLAIARLVGTTPLTLDGPVHLPFMPGDVPLLVMNLDDPQGPRVALDLSAGPLRLSGSVGTEDGPLPVTASLPRLRLTGDTDGAAWSGRLQTRGGSVTLPTYAMTATGMDLSVDLASNASPRIGLGATLTHEGDPAYVVPLTARISAQQARDGWAFTGSAKDPFDRVSLAIEGRHDLVRGTGGATLKLAPIEFAPNVRQPGDLAPWLAGFADEVSGTVALAGDVSWTSSVITSNLELLLRDLSFTTAAATIERVNGVIAVDGLAPYSTPPGQKVAVARIDAGLPLTDGLITFQVAPGPRLEIAGGTLHLAGGTVELEPLTFDPAGSRTDGVLQVEGVELGELLALAGVNGLTGSGLMSGRIPVAVEKEDVIITGGVLDAQAPGFLSYAPLSPPAALQGQGETVSLALSALTNFQYQALRLTVDRQAGGEMTVTMHVRGNNPDFYDGYPVEFNLNVSGALDQVLRDSLTGYRIPETIEERLNEFAQ